jgi:hypothetical protein
MKVSKDGSIAGWPECNEPNPWPKGLCLSPYRAATAIGKAQAEQMGGRDLAWGESASSQSIHSTGMSSKIVHRSA